MDQYTRLENLMAEKSFADLSQTERTWVEQYLSAADYEVQRQIISAVQQEPPPLPPNALEEELMQAFRNHHVPASIPFFTGVAKPLLWAAALIGVFFIGRWSQAASTDITTLEVPIVTTVYEIQKDTIYVDKTIRVPTNIYKETIIRDTIYIYTPLELPIATNNPELMPILPIEPLQEFSAKVKGDEEIYKILVDVY